MRSVSASVPTGLKRYLKRTVLEPAKRQINDWALGRAIRILRGSGSADRALLASMRRAWGNEAYSADLSYLCELVARVSNCSGHVLECGSGLTTILAGVLAERRSVTVYSLEQDSGWAEVVERALKKYRIRQVQVSYAPLQRHDGFVWYDHSALRAFPKRFELVLCDGPAVLEHWGPPFHAQWRYGILPALAVQSASAGEILLEDADDSRAEKMLCRWQEEFGTSHRMIHSADGACAVVSCHG
jgi:hypothetical protein